MPKDTATYLYCVVKSVRRPGAAQAGPGLPGAAPPESYEVGRGLWLIAAEVPLQEYGPGRLETRLSDLEWVATAAVGHESVVEHFARRSTATVIPAKLFTMFSTVDKAIADVARRRKSIDRVMKRIAGCEEWGVRITRRAVAAATRGAVADDRSPSASGTAFLTAKKAARDTMSEARAAAVAAAEDAFHALARRARDARNRERRPEPGSNPPVLEAAFLVPTSARAKFKVEARRQGAACQKAGADLALSGPWPAYNFVGDPT